MPTLDALLSRLDLDHGGIAGRPRLERRLADVREAFADRSACEAALRTGNPLLYTVSSEDERRGCGDLHFGLGVLMPGKVGAEYYLTKGHLHARREAAEVYVGLRGQGAMLLEAEDSDEARLVELAPQSVVYVPGCTAHRTVNVGTEPLMYLGIYPADAGHDYQTIAARNFRHVVVERAGRPVLLRRTEFLETLR